MLRDHDLTGQIHGEKTCWVCAAASIWNPRMKTLEERLGQRIARQRRAVGLTQSQLAEKVDVQPETISRIETGSKTASLDLVAHICEALELELHELFRLQSADNPKGRAVERLLWFASRLSLPEIELVLDVGATVLKHTRRTDGPNSARS